MNNKKAALITSMIIILSAAVLLCLFLLGSTVALVIFSTIIGLLAGAGIIYCTRGLFSWIANDEATLKPVICENEKEDKEITLEEIIGEVANGN